ncbi:T9SS type A sorting domain-containing protein [Flavobacterium urocaniciphilum]|uniref:Por secretion system C-terminal sorting domain-containing protein n=1 Tax=Flavobacterium urocaniciphilum TaxID=1299341 RepID=A0A1H9E189_9FLAO|nr:T9SS type A sorting domain-containing protein [Flavobacterium urocaniciphilum]SEQ19451.1 Por secretion system C-terminal sorting domain-containing protein [Flavobacterium urocaniciphilum]
MKKIYSLLLIALSSVSFGQVTLPFSDSFNYPAGNLHETSPWSLLGTASASDHILLDGSKATFAGGGTDAQLLFTSQTTGTVFYKLNLNILSMAGVTDANGGYIAGFAQNSTTFGGTLWAKRVDDTTYNLGIEVRTGTTTNTTWTPATYTTGVSNTIVVAYTFNTVSTSDDVVRLWINPAPTDEATPLLTDTHTGTDLTSAPSFFLRQDSATETGSVEVDNVKVSLTFAEILSSSSFSQIDSLKMYPNPTKNNLYIETALNGAINVSIVNMLGKEVVNTNVVNNTVNVSNLTSGIYIVKITEEGKTSTKKLIIE